MTKNRYGGFTLLELLVALAVASVVVLAVTGTLFSISKSQEIAAQESERLRSLRNISDLLRRELSSALYQLNNKQLRFLVEDRDYYGKPASTLALSTLAPPLSDAVSDQVWVQYSLEESAGGMTLRRTARDLFQVETTEQQFSYPVMEQLEGFLVECYDGSKWIKTWDTELIHRLPQIIRISLIVQENGKSVTYQVIASPRINAQ